MYYWFSSSYRGIHVMEVQIKEAKLDRISFQNAFATRCALTFNSSNRSSNYRSSTVSYR